MKKEIKSAIIGASIIVVALAGITLYFASLDKTSQNLSLSNSTTISSQEKNNMPDLSSYPLAPDLTGIASYINTTPEDLKTAMKSKVVLYDFWTYSCINCIRTFPFLKAWNEKYSNQGLLIIGVHSPEFEFEKDVNNVKLATQKYGLTYPVVLDNDHKTWDAFGNRYWPAEYIADDLGHIRHTHFGEGEYDQSEKIIQQLLVEREQRMNLTLNITHNIVNIEPHEFAFQQTPELYFGYDFAQGRSYLGNSEGFQPEKMVNYSLPSNLQRDNFYLEGQWQNLPDSMKLASNNGKIVLPYFANDVNIVAAGPGSNIQIQLDNKPVLATDAGQDVNDSTTAISEHRLYNIISSKQAGAHTLTITAPTGFEIYTFTFG